LPILVGILIGPPFYRPDARAPDAVKRLSLYFPDSGGIEKSGKFPLSGKIASDKPAMSDKGFTHGCP
jgi:hypothetical protein